MAIDMVMRSVFLPPADDAMLRELAFRTNLSKSEIIRQVIKDFLESDKPELMLKGHVRDHRDVVVPIKASRKRSGANAGAAPETPRPAGKKPATARLRKAAARR